MSEVLARFFGNPVSSSTTSTTQPGGTRSFTSFSQAAEENGNSRVYIGFHFRHAVTEGLNWAARRAKLPSTTTCSRFIDLGRNEFSCPGPDLHDQTTATRAGRSFSRGGTDMRLLGSTIRSRCWYLQTITIMK